ncbi:Spy/CpxP family protein refolding chaperone [Reichenbachiella sp. MALMAid0571]|uniref:Spy/CpxP family protein refolding chaperone n=1 Tax=Reichenbachiella sp. MALMAid0571 TaxID=3143939 RepID=UPI0032DEF508
MNFFTQNKTATIIIAMLIALNVLSIYFFVIHKRIVHKHPFDDQNPPWHEKSKEGKSSEKVHFMEKELGLNKEQRQEYRNLRKSHFEMSRKKRKEQQELREMIFSNISNQSFNIDSVAQLISKRQSEMEIGMFKHFKSIRELCTEEQKLKFDKTTQFILRKMGDHDRFKRSEH